MFPVEVKQHIEERLVGKDPKDHYVMCVRCPGGLYLVMPSPRAVIEKVWNDPTNQDSVETLQAGSDPTDGILTLLREDVSSGNQTQALLLAYKWGQIHPQIHELNANVVVVDIVENNIAYCHVELCPPLLH